MEPNYNFSTILLLAFLLIITNLKPILIFREWLNFKINTTFKQYKNERKNKVN
ncbi:hypothetical protein SAMN05444484_10344 [Flavobacterium chilense]|uniref:Uncharacterized protein n=1 Tax=Flavobacterium chilense TaxID=946677 RepID=A0A1M7ERX6_9FLAO|nr:hypothetical protein SAMN05444484_10344 [Flavobacterium chilense]